MLVVPATPSTITLWWKGPNELGSVVKLRVVSEESVATVYSVVSTSENAFVLVSRSKKYISITASSAGAVLNVTVLVCLPTSRDRVIAVFTPLTNT